MADNIVKALNAPIRTMQKQLTFMALNGRAVAI